MNSTCYRVVFNERLGAWVAVAENVAARGKRSRGRARTLASMALAISMTSVAVSVDAAPPLPVEASSATRTATNAGLGMGAVTTSGNTMTIVQRDATAIKNWDSFNIDKGYKLVIDQKDSSYRLLNRVWDGRSDINGSIEAKGQVFIVNHNGIIFGKDSQINVGGLVASALNIKIDDFNKGILSQSATGKPTFYYAAGTLDANGTLVDIDTSTTDVSALGGSTPTVRNEGAIHATSEGGSIMLFAPRVENAGLITSSGGQVVLAAGAKVYLTESKSTALRGVLVEVDPFVGGNKDSSSVSNTGLKEAMQGIIADRGNITLAAMAVNNNGFLQASSGKVENGSIYLQGRYSTAVVLKDNIGSDVTNRVTVAQQGGEVVLGANSRIEAPVESISEDEVKARALAQFVPEAGETAAVRESRLSALQDLVRKQYTVLKSDTFKPAEIVIDGRTVLMQSGARITAPSANVTVLAAGERKFGKDLTSTTDSTANTDASYLSNAADDPGARIVMEAGATVDVSGYQNVAVDGGRNQISATLVSNELKDAPLQRDGVLYRKTVTFNLLDAPTGKMGIADASGVVNNLQYSLPEAAAKGGAISLQSVGDVVIGTGATLNVSGGSVKYSDATIATTQLTLGTQRVDINKASADVVYGGIETAKRFVPGYVEGKDAGSISIAGRGTTVLDGNLLGKTTPGIHQATPTTAPKGASLVLGDILGRLNKVGVSGNNGQSVFSYGRDLRFAAGSALKDAMTFWADPLNASVSDKPYNLVSSDTLVGGGFQSITAYADGVTIAAGSPVNLSVGFRLTLRTTGNIDIQDDIRGAGMTLDAQAGLAGISSGAISLSAGKKVNASGMWINDYDSFRTSRTVYAGVRQTDGGAVTLRSVLHDKNVVDAAAALTLGAGSSIDVSGGGELGAGGALKVGNAGSITLAGGSDLTLDNVTLTGKALTYGPQVGKGGTLSIEAPSIRIGGVTKSSADLGLQSDLFTRNGFSSFNLTATQGNINVVSGTLLDLQRNLLLLDGGFRSVTTGSALTRLGSDAKLGASVKDGVSLSMAATKQTATSFGFDMGVIDIGAGSRIDVGAGGSIDLTAGRQLTVAGSLQAQGGSVALSIKKPESSNDPGDLADQSIFMTDTATVDVSGKALVVTDRLGRVTGDVLAGGQFSVAAGKGYIVAQQGAQVRLEGAAATLYNASAGGSLNVASNAGMLSLDAPAGILFGAHMSAQGGGANAAGGTFALAQSPSSENFAASERVVNIGNDVYAPAGVVSGVLSAATPGFALGSESLTKTQAWVDAKALAVAGFDNVSIKSDDRIRFIGDVALVGKRQLSLSAGVFDVSSANVSLSGAEVRLGWSGRNSNASVIDMGIKTPAAGTGTFTVKASQIDLSGSLSVGGARKTVLESSGDIRLAGVHITSPDDTHPAPVTDYNTGNLSVSGDLDLKAAQIYPTTSSDFTISVAPGTADKPSALNVISNGATPQVPLAAGGRLALVADNINQAGVLRAPFGAIDLSARNALTLQDGSLTSASGEGATIPFGTLVNGTDWTVAPTGGAARILTSAPQPSVALRGKTIEQQADAKIDVSGGGDLKAVEWVPGSGGSANVLSQANTYAIIPGYASAYAPDSAGFDRMVGTQITLGAAAGLPAGTYTLLPASYALQPGAFKVTLLSSYKDAAPGLQVSQALGGAVVSGRLSVANTAVSESHTQGVLVEAGDVTRKRSEYSEVVASSFFDSKAAATGAVPTHGTADGGHLILAASDSIKLGDKISLDALADGKVHRGGMLDVSLLATTLNANGQPTGDILVGSGTTAPTPGITTLQVSDTQIAKVGAESVLIGGERGVTANGAAITVTANNLRYNSTVGFDTNGSKPAEVILAASNKLTVVSGSVIETAAHDVGRPAALQASVKGDGALLRVAADDKSVIRTSVEGKQGTLIAESGVKLIGHAVQADATLDTQMAKDSAATAKVFSLGTRLVTLGGTGSSTGTGGTRLSGALLSSVAGSAESLTLRSYGGIKFDEGFILGGDSPVKGLTFDAPSLEWTGSGPGTVQINARQLTLTNTTGASATATTGSAGLVLNAVGTATDGSDAGIFRIGSGDVSLRGFGTATLSATRAVVMSGSGTSSVAGDLRIATPLVTAESGARHTVQSDGALTLTVAGARASDVVASGGAAIKFDAASISQDNSIVNNSGTVILNARGSDVVLTQDALIDVSSKQADFSGTVRSTDAGSITLSAAVGDVKLLAGAVLDLQGKGDSSAGSLNVIVPKGEAILDGTMKAGITEAGKAADAAAGRFYLDTFKLGSLDNLNRLTTAFTAERSVRLRQGDLKLSTGETLIASAVNLYADAGSIFVDGVIDASGKKGGSIDLAARRDFVTSNGTTAAQGGQVIVNGTLDAHASEIGEDGGTIRISVSAADSQVLDGVTVDPKNDTKIAFGKDSQINLQGGSGGKDGRLILNAPRIVNLADYHPVLASAAIVGDGPSVLAPLPDTVPLVVATALNSGALPTSGKTSSAFAISSSAYAGFDGTSTGYVVEFVAEVNNSGVLGGVCATARCTTLSINGSKAYIIKNATGASNILANQIRAGNSYVLMLNIPSSGGTPTWRVQESVTALSSTTVNNLSSSASLIPVSLFEADGITKRVPREGDVLYVTPQSANFGGAVSNLGSGGVKLSINGKYYALGGGIPAGSILAGTSYVAKYANGSFTLLSSSGAHETVRLLDPGLTGNPLDSYNIRFTALANNATDDVEVQLNGIVAGRLYASDGVTPIGAGTLVGGQSYSIGRLADGRYALRPASFGQIAVEADDPARVAFSISDPSSLVGATSLRLKVKESVAVPLVGADGGLVDVGALVAGKTYVAVQSGGSYRLLNDSALASDVPIANNGVILSGVPRVEVNAFSTYSVPVPLDGSPAVINNSLLNQVAADSQTFASWLPAIQSKLAFKPEANVTIQPGVEIRSTGDMILADDVNFMQKAADGSYLWRYNGDKAAGSLVLRAGGKLQLSGALNDGFSDNTSSRPETFTQGWSYSLVGGADLHAANVLATSTVPASGDVTVKQKVRTGAGDIRVAAAGDIDLSASTAGVYSAGIRVTGAVDDLALPLSAPTGSWLTEQGGSVAMRAGANILGRTDAEPQNWLWRTVSPLSATPSKSAAWLVRYDRFGWVVGALGGGNVSLLADDSVRDVSVALPSQARYGFDASGKANAITTLNGGDLSVRAGNEIVGGQYLAERGSAFLYAGGNIAADKSGLGPRLYAADTRFYLNAGADLVLGSINSVPWQLQAAANRGISTTSSMWLSYSDDSLLDLRSASGNVTVSAGGGASVLPSSFQAVALGGSISLGGDLPVAPSARGQLGLFAEGNIESKITMVDVAPEDVGTALHPFITSKSLSDADGTMPFGAGATRFYDNGVQSFGVRAVNSSGVGSLHDGDTETAKIISRSGDVSGTYIIAKPTEISAGRDVVDLSLSVENVGTHDVSRVTAGRDIVYSTIPKDDVYQTTVKAGGKPVPNPEPDTAPGIKVFGPGLLEVTAGRNIDLANAGGIVSKGPGVNSYLPDTGASIRVVAGKPTSIDAEKFAASYLDAASAPAFLALTTDEQLGFATAVLRQRFIDAYLQPSSLYFAQWQAYAAANGIGATDAVMTDPAKTSSPLFDRFRYRVLWAELSASGQEGPTATYARGFKAIALMGLSAPFNSNGNVRMVFSQIRTQAGGDADVLVPGGSLDVGPTEAPDAAQVSDVSKLGLVANQGDSHVFVRDSINVNTSRWFAIDGGNLLGWASTGSIDAGKGSRTAISGSSQRLDVDRLTGKFTLVDGGASSGSGIATIFNKPSTTGGNVELYAPNGFINAGEAGIRAATKFSATEARINAGFISDSGGTKAPPAAPSAPALPVSTAGASGEKTATEAGGTDAKKPRERSSILTVEVLATEPERDPAAGSAQAVCIADPKVSGKPVCN